MSVSLMAETLYAVEQMLKSQGGWFPSNYVSFVAANFGGKARSTAAAANFNAEDDVGAPTTGAKTRLNQSTISGDHSAISCTVSSRSAAN